MNSKGVGEGEGNVSPTPASEEELYWESGSRWDAARRWREGKWERKNDG